MVFDEDLQRLEQLAGIEESLIALALHALWEKILRAETGTPYTTSSAEGPFVDAPELLRRLISQNPSLRNRLDDSFIRDFAKSRSWTNAVRHNFIQLETRRFHETLLQFETFCYHFPVFSTPELVQQTLSKLRQASPQKLAQREKEFVALLERNTALQQQLVRNEAELTSYLDLAHEINLLNAERSLFKDELELAELALQKERQQRYSAEMLSQENEQVRQQLEQRVQELKAQLNHTQQAQNQLSQQMATYQVHQEYFEVNEEISVYFRGEARYRNLVQQLSPDQSSAVHQAALHRGDCLIKGPVGSGKSLVLLRTWCALQEHSPGDYPLLVSTKPLLWYLQQELEAHGLNGLNGVSSNVELIDDFLSRSRGNPSAPRYPKILVDEAQELTAQQIDQLRKLSRDGLILAGDFSNPAWDSWIAFSLQRSFRCPQPLLDFVSSWKAPARLSYDGLGSERPGFPPLSLSVRSEALTRTLLLQIRTLLERFGYAPEALLLVPLDGSGQLEQKVCQAIAAENIPLVNLDSFSHQPSSSQRDFPSGIRISSGPSALGLTFSVVLVILSQPLVAGTQQSLLATQAFTRASERLIVLVQED